MAVPGLLHAPLAGGFPEATWVLLPHERGVVAREAADKLPEQYARASALLIGPGFGLEDTTREFIQDLVAGDHTPEKGASRIGFVQSDQKKTTKQMEPLPPLVIDADGLKLLAEIKDWHKLLPKAAVLTPHPGEMAILAGLPIEEVQADRLGTALKYAKKWGHVLVLKGAFTVIASPAGNAAVLPVASAALARAGTGDVLAGLIVGLRAQGLEAFEAAVSGAWIHAQAGLIAAEDLGTTASVLAGDLLESIPDVLVELDG
jgi:NAD(P)H-hydrate epimerase